ncbi:60S acidic ribosomal protein P2-like protein [Dinothrombium tinctorium]|uniref:Large ribosomal subunit protein P2 n=1 Tax=Dinothrombium tinctorium TaxID=1965070 RepID=A0A3S3QYY4_9ACAR|nr:60S acidic ribosomal protein P2-like protein [Dinothrombium tinctorium]
MRYVSAYLLATLGGNKNPTVDDISKILGSVGIEVDADKAKKVVDELKGKDIDEVIRKGSLCVCRDIIKNTCIHSF